MQLLMTTRLQKSNELRSNATDVLAPLTVIRTETILSRLPMHNLAKRGEVDISINTKNDRGELDLQWEVSYNKKYGDARQLAYKLDTIVINRKIDEATRPLPKVIRLGSLREIGIDLDLTAGKALVNLRKAFHQNAGAYITANLKYKSLDGTERSLEAGFNRYSVYFTGQQLPDGSKADGVYLILSEPYWEVLNNAPTRPLDYDYLKALAPAAQRFYEIVSFKIFAALKYHHSTAKISYSEYCTFSAQQRYQDYEHVKKQMYKVHRPHLQSGYLIKVSCDAVRDSSGNLDWIFYYTPGPKAVAAFKKFNKNHAHSGLADDNVIEGEASDNGPAATDPGDAQAREIVGEFQRLFHNVKHSIPLPKELKHAAQVISEHGIEKARHFVRFSHQVAQETKYQPQNFSGIMQYQARAIADFESRQKNQQATQATTACSLCDKSGMLSLKDAKNQYTALKCSHNVAQMKAYAESKGYQIV
jgi:hypothetical protein